MRLIIVVFLGLVACTRPVAPTDLVGTWEARAGTTPEALVLSEDRRFQHVFQSGEDRRHLPGTWSLADRTNGTQYIMLKYDFDRRAFVNHGVASVNIGRRWGRTVLLASDDSEPNAVVFRRMRR